MAFKTVFALFAASVLLASNSTFAAMRISEWMYNGSEYIEFTNIGGPSVDMTGWSFDDDSRAPGTVDLSAFGLVAAGESVVLAEEATAAFKTRWSLGAAVKVIGSNAANLGRADEINLFDGLGALVDRLTYGDTVIPPPTGGSIRTQDISGNPGTPAAIGANNVTQWVLSSPGDRFGSYTSVGGFVGNPGVNVPEPASIVALAMAGVILACGCRRSR